MNLWDLCNIFACGYFYLFILVYIYNENVDLFMEFVAQNIVHCSYATGTAQIPFTLLLFIISVRFRESIARHFWLKLGGGEVNQNLYLVYAPVSSLL